MLKECFILLFFFKLKIIELILKTKEQGDLSSVKTYNLHNKKNNAFITKEKT